MASARPVATDGFEVLRATRDSSVWALALFGSNRQNDARYYSLRRRAWSKISPFTPETGIISSLRARFTLCFLLTMISRPTCSLDERLDLLDGRRRPNAMAALDGAGLVKEEDAVKVPLDLTWVGLLGKRPYRMGLRSIHLRLGHQVTAGRLSWHALLLGKRADLVLWQLLRAKLVRREVQYLEAWAKLLVQIRKELVATPRRASSARDVHNEGWLAGERAHVEIAAIDEL